MGHSDPKLRISTMGSGENVRLVVRTMKPWIVVYVSVRPLRVSVRNVKPSLSWLRDTELDKLMGYFKNTS